MNLQSLTMWYAAWGTPHWHRLSLPNPHFTIESPNFPIPVLIYLVEPRLSEGGHALGICLISLRRVVAVYVVLVLAGDHSLVMIPEMNGEVCEI